MRRAESSIRRMITSAAQLTLPSSCTSPLDPSRSRDLCTPPDAVLLPEISEDSNIASQLVEIGLPPAIARQISNAYIKTTRELHDASQSSLRNALRTASATGDKETHSRNKAWNAALTQQTYAWAENNISRARDAVFSLARGAVATGKSTLVESAKEMKPVFNHEYTPFLEKYFEYNAYPSPMDRAVLARKSMMTPRQIEVWFQNHRNRSKKDGKPLRKLALDPLPLEISLKSLERSMPFFTIPEHQRQAVTKTEPAREDSPNAEDMSSMSTPSCDPTAAGALNPPRPSHAFPTVYPPRCDYDPFPNRIRPYSFPAPIWYRKPATPPSTSNTPIDIDELIGDFESKLHLRVPTSLKQRSKLAVSWWADRVTILSPAPHPAFVRSPFVPPSRCPSPLATVTTSSSRLHPSRLPSPFSQPSTFIFPNHSNDTPTRRKVARLPKRTPKNTSIAHSRCSPAISEASSAPSRSSSSNSRSSSFGTDTSSERRHSSSSSSSSTSSSAPATPEQSYASFSHDAGAPSVSFSGIDFEKSWGLFAERPESFSSGEGTPSEFSMVAPPKQLFTFGLEVPAAGQM
ncbi:hypothetical protein FPV67DRAFT_1775975 [Lyophyllum atratum]|nr:hypothetical protein FPV67DRAFT_1775975 [Lyophyllum atratum]